MLIKMRQNYWCIIDIKGQIRAIPSELNKLLNRTSFTDMTATMLYEQGTTKVVLNSLNKIATVLFNHNGEIAELNEFSKFGT